MLALNFVLGAASNFCCLPPCPQFSLHSLSSPFQVIIPHGEPVTVETFLAWRERFEAELALERAK